MTKQTQPKENHNESLKLYTQKQERSTPKLRRKAKNRNIVKGKAQARRNIGKLLGGRSKCTIQREIALGKVKLLNRTKAVRLQTCPQRKSQAGNTQVPSHEHALSTSLRSLLRSYK